MTEKATCSCCGAEDSKKTPVEQRYSFGIYAGILCEDCAYRKYIDHCGIGGEQGDPYTLDEPIDSDY